MIILFALSGAYASNWPLKRELYRDIYTNGIQIKLKLTWKLLRRKLFVNKLNIQGKKRTSKRMKTRRYELKGRNIA